MPVYIWEARTKAGDLRTGEYKADSEDAVGERLRSQGLTASRVKKKPLELTLPTLGTGVAFKDMVCLPAPSPP